MIVGKQACFSNIPKVLFTLTHLSPLGESVVSAASFNKVKDKAQFLHGGCRNWLGFSGGFLGNGISEAKTYTSMSA